MCKNFASLFNKHLPTEKIKKNLTLAVLLVLLASVLSACSAGGGLIDNYLAPSLILPQGKAHKLEVIHGAPSGELSLPEQLAVFTIVFNQPMVNLGTRQVEIEGLKVEPELRGEWAWRGTACLTFTPSEPLKISHKYKVTIPAGLTALTGQKLAKPYTLNFITPRPAVIYSSHCNGGINVSVKKPIQLLFNQPIKNEKALSSFKLSSDSGTTACNVKLASADELFAFVKDLKELCCDNSFMNINGFKVDLDKLTANQVVIITPNENLKLGTKYTILVPENFKADESAQLGSAADYKISFTTNNIFSLKSVTSSGNNRPEEAIHFSFTSPVHVSDLAKNLSFEPNLSIPKCYLEDNYVSDNVSLELPFAARTTYKVKINPNLKDDFGSPISSSEEITYTTTDFAPYLLLSSGQVVADAKAQNGTIAFSSINLDSVLVEGKVLSLADIAEMMKNYFFTGGEDEFSFSSGFDFCREVKLNNKLNSYTENNLDCKQFLDSQYGLLFVRLTYQNAEGSTSRRSLFVQFTDLCLTAKFSASQNLIWVTSLDSGKPLPNVNINLYDHKADCVASAVTDENGVAKLPGWASHSKAEKRDMQFMVASLGEDRAFINSRGYDSLSAAKSGIFVYDSSASEEILSSVITDKGIYKAGENLKFKILVRSNKNSRLSVPKQIKNVEYTVTDSNGNAFASGTLPLSSVGSADASVSIPEETSSGYGSIQFKLSKYEAERLNLYEDIAWKSYRIEDYQPVQSETKVVSSQKMLVAGEKLQGYVEGRFLFGAPMSNDKFRYSSTAEKLIYTNDKYPEYTFGNDFYSQDNEEGNLSLASGSGTLDSNGRSKIELSTEGIKYEYPSKLTVDASVVSSSGKEVSCSYQVPVWPLENIVGLNTENFLIKQNSSFTGKFVVVNKDGQVVKGVPVKFEFICRQWDSVYKAGTGGAYSWVSEPKDTAEGTAVVYSKAEATEFSFVPKSSGCYVVRAYITGKNGKRSSSEMSLWCAGSDYSAWERSNDDEILLNCNKKDYNIGETAKILVQSPFEEANALITVESDTVLDSWVSNLKGSSPVIDVPIKDFYAPNVYVSVLMVKGREGKVSLSKDGLDLSKPTYKFGYAELKVKNPKNKLKVEVSADLPKYKPGQNVSIDVKMTDSEGRPAAGEVCLWVVDEGVLNLIDYKMPDYIDSFYGPRWLTVNTSENCADVIGLRSYGAKGDNQGGGGGSSDDSVREDFTPTILWKPVVKVDSTGRASVRFKAPDGLTRYRIMAAACDAAERFGQGEASFEVSKNLVLLPSIIPYARSGDSFQIGILARNNTDKAASVSIEADSKSLSLANTSVKASLKPGDEKLMLFDASASVCGKFPIVFKGRMGSDSDICKYTLEVIADEKSSVAAVSGSFNTAEAEESIKISGGAKSGSAILETSISNNLAVMLNGVVSDLWKEDDTQVDESIDKLLMRMQLLIEAEKLGLKLPNSLTSAEQRRIALKNYVVKLSKFRVYSGGFSSWKNGNVSNTGYSAWALSVLSKLNKEGLLNDSQVSMYNETVDYAKLKVGEDILRLKDLKHTDASTNLAYLFSVLCRIGQGQDSTLVVLYRARQSFSLQGRAYILAAASELQNKDIISSLRQEMSNLLKVEERQAWFEENREANLACISVRASDNAAVLTAMLQSGGFELAPKVFSWLSANRVMGHWETSRADSTVTEAFAVYSNVAKVSHDDVKVKVRSGGKQLLEGTLKFPDSSCLFASNSVALVGQKMAVNMSQSGSSRIYYDMLLRYVPVKPLPALDNGFYLFQSCSPLNDPERPIPFSDLKFGQVYRMSVSVISSVNRDQVVVNVPIPAGLEVVNTDFDTESNIYADLLNRINANKCYGTFTNAEFYSDHVKIWAQGLQAGEHTYSFLVRAAACGSYRVPGAEVYQKERPEVFGSTAETRIKIGF
ncbi:MAG: Ig-like domain-containing protein [Candidatus Bruticola sp.]